MLDIKLKYSDLLKRLKSELDYNFSGALILGSGLGDFADDLELVKEISTADLMGYPKSTVAGHAGKIIAIKIEEKYFLLFKGRIHYYEGYSIRDCVLPVLISKELKCKNLILTNAAGGINKYFKPGDLMLVSSFIGVSIKNEISKLIGLTGFEQKNNFIDFPSNYLNESIKKSALAEKIDLKEGVYFFTKGPSYETPAEIKMMERLGGDAVGMSTYHEAVYGAYIGLKTAAISCITNYAAGISSQKLDHSEVTETANMVKEKFSALIDNSLKNL